VVVEDLYPPDKAFIQHLLLKLRKQAGVNCPSRMIEHDECPLVKSRLQRLFRIGLVNGIRIFNEQSVKMTNDSLFAGHLGPFDKHDAVIPGHRQRQFVGCVEIPAHVFFERTVFNMIGNGQHIQPLYPGFPNAVGGPYQAV